MRKIRFVVATALLAGVSSFAVTEGRGPAAWLVTPAAAQSALVFENLTLSFPLMTYRIPRLEVTGTNLSRAEFFSLFDVSAPELLASRLAKLDAREIRIPELITEQKQASDRQTIVYRDVRMVDIRGGRMARMTVQGGSLEADLKDAPRMSGTFGPLEITGFDLRQTARVYTQKASGPAEPLQPLYDGFGMSDLAVSVGGDGSFRIDRISGTQFSARPTAESWIGALSLAEKLDSGSLPDGEQSKTMRALVDVLSSFSLGRIVVDGVSFTAPRDAEEAKGRIGQIVLAGTAVPGENEMSFRDFSMTAKSGSARIGLISFKGFSFEPTLEGLVDLSDKSPDDLSVEDFRKLAPLIGTMRVEGVDFDVPNTEAPRQRGRKPENIRFTMRALEVTADKPVNGVPTNVRLALDNLAFPVPANSRDQGLRTLGQLGYDKVDLSSALHASWNEPGSELVLREVSVSGADMGSFAVRGTLGNITRDVFGHDSAVAMVALLGATAKTLHVSLQDTGLANRFLAAEAKKRKRSAEDLRKEFGAMAAFGLPAMLGNSEAAKTITNAVARFIARPGRLEMSARARNGGLGVADVMAAGGAPPAILEQLEVTATVE